MNKMTDLHSYERVESTECTEELFQEVSCSSQAPDGEISSGRPFHSPPAFCITKTKMGSREGSWFQKFPLLFGYVTIQSTINSYSMCHIGAEDLQSIFSFKSIKCEILSPYVKKIK